MYLLHRAVDVDGVIGEECARLMHQCEERQNGGHVKQRERVPHDVLMYHRQSIAHRRRGPKYGVMVERAALGHRGRARGKHDQRGAHGLDVIGNADEVLLCHVFSAVEKILPGLEGTPRRVIQRNEMLEFRCGVAGQG